MRLLLDTNLFLEVLLEQEKQALVIELLRRERESFFISDYSLHSIGLLLFRQKRWVAFADFVEDLQAMGVELASLSLEEVRAVGEAAQCFGLDFDDAYQYVVAEKHALSLVSFDRDFDRTERGRVRPESLAE